MKKMLKTLGLLALALCALIVSGCGGEKTAKRELKVYNAGPPTKTCMSRSRRGAVITIW